MGHMDRLLKVLEDSETDQLRKLKVIALLGEMMTDDDAFTQLKAALQDKNLAQQAAVALGNLGKDSIPILTEMLKNAKEPDLQAAVAKGLGQVGALHGDPGVIPPLLEILFQPGIDMKVRTEVVWAIGKMPDKRAIEPLHQLDRELQAIRSEDPAIKTLKEAAFWSLKMTDTELSSENPSEYHPSTRVRQKTTVFIAAEDLCAAQTVIHPLSPPTPPKHFDAARLYKCFT